MHIYIITIDEIICKLTQMIPSIASKSDKANATQTYTFVSVDHEENHGKEIATLQAPHASDECSTIGEMRPAPFFPLLEASKVRAVCIDDRP